jgi:hypothetical protein
MARKALMAAGVLTAAAIEAQPVGFDAIQALDPGRSQGKFPRGWNNVAILSPAKNPAARTTWRGRSSVAAALISASLLAAAAAQSQTAGLAQIATVSIYSLVPSSGPIGTAVTITGSGFSPTGNAIRFGIGGTIDVPSHQNGTVVDFTIPEYIGPCSLIAYKLIRCMAPAMVVRPGIYQISVVNAQQQSSNEVSFTVTS